MHKVVPINNHIEYPGLYEPVKPGLPRLLVFPIDSAIVALQLDPSPERPAFTFVTLGSEPIGFGVRVARFQLETNKDDRIEPPESTVGAMVLTPDGMGLKVRNSDGRLGILWICDFDDVPRKSRPKRRACHRWSISKQGRQKKPLFESHPAAKKSGLLRNSKATH